jgi:microcompartment protein CcmL/EutN
MDLHKFRTMVTNMSSAIALAQNLERRERGRGFPVKAARARLADKLRVGYGTFENLVRGRVKTVDASIRDRLQALLIREIEAEIQRLQHELEIARQTGARLDSDQVCEIETHIQKAQALLANAAAAR